jgi:hypothetical protein
LAISVYSKLRLNGAIRLSKTIDGAQPMIGGKVIVEIERIEHRILLATLLPHHSDALLSNEVRTA